MMRVCALGGLGVLVWVWVSVAASQAHATGLLKMEAAWVSGDCSSQTTLASDDMPLMVVRHSVCHYAPGQEEPGCAPHMPRLNHPDTVVGQYNAWKMTVQALDGSKRTFVFHRLTPKGSPLPKGEVLYGLSEPLPPGRYQLPGAGSPPGSVERREAKRPQVGRCAEATRWRPTDPTLKEVELRTEVSWVDGACRPLDALAVDDMPLLQVRYIGCRLGDDGEECGPHPPPAWADTPKSKTITLQGRSRRGTHTLQRLAPQGWTREDGLALWGADAPLPEGSYWGLDPKRPHRVDAQPQGRPRQGRCAEAAAWTPPDPAPSP